MKRKRQPKNWHESAPVSAVAHRNTWDVTPDGREFLINSSQENTSSAIPITVVVNWREGKSGR